MEDSIVALIRLVSGEELICKITDEQDGFWIVTNPHIIHMQMSAQGAQLSLYPFMMYADGHQIKIMAAAVGCIAIPDEKMEQAYKRQLDPKAVFVPEKPSLIVP